MPNEKDPSYEKIRTGDFVLFRDDAPDDKVAPFLRGQQYCAGFIRGTAVELAGPMGPTPVELKYLIKAGDAGKREN